MKNSTLIEIVAGVRELVGDGMKVEAKSVTKNNGVVCVGINIAPMGGGEGKGFTSDIF